MKQMLGVGFGVERGEAGRLVGDLGSTFRQGVWTAPGVEMFQAGSPAQIQVFDMKEVCCQLLCEEQQEESRREWKELSVNPPLGVLQICGF